jgi:inorganic pyrophosphatase
MDLNKITPGSNPPYEINVVIEIPQGSVPIKYEVEKTSGALFVDRFLHTPMVYPANYGFIPGTLCDDGDPCDVLVISQIPVVPLAVIRSRPIGALVMTDEHGADEKVIAVPTQKLNPYYENVHALGDLPAIVHDQIAHFFAHYKDLEPGKWVNISRWMDPAETHDFIMRAISRGTNAHP